MMTFERYMEKDQLAAERVRWISNSRRGRIEYEEERRGECTVIRVSDFAPTRFRNEDGV
jgi:hypothetical protein